MDGEIASKQKGGAPRASRTLRVDRGRATSDIGRNGSGERREELRPQRRAADGASARRQHNLDACLRLGEHRAWQRVRIGCLLGGPQSQRTSLQ
eukprot:scaffold4649_cov34-Tisochrysis_lutea.AAC.1